MKKLLLTFIIWIFWFIGFWYCDTIFTTNTVWTRSSTNINLTLASHKLLCVTFNNTNITNCHLNWTAFANKTLICLYNDTDSSTTVTTDCQWVTSSRTLDYWIVNWNHNLIQQWLIDTMCENQWYILSSSVNSSYCTSNWLCPSCTECDDPYTSLECQEEYNLIPIEDIDINYCVWNWLCPNESWTWDFTWDLQFSNIYINNILHPWKQNIFVTIPDYITWDYSFTGDDFNIYVWSWYDEEYINSIIKINSYRPTDTDFSDIFISWLTLIFPYIVVTLFIVFVWRLLKRIFK